MSNVLQFYGFEMNSKSSSSPDLTRSQRCFKLSLGFFNILFLIFGCVLAAVGSYALSGHVNALAGVTVPRGIIVVGVMIILISIMGLLASWKESRLFLSVYFFFILILTVILFSVGIAVFVEKDKSGQYMSQGWRSLDYMGSPDSANEIRIDLQNSLDCCGLTVFNVSAGYPCPATALQTKQTCLPRLQSVFESNFGTAGSCAIGFSIVMIFGMVFVCILMEGIKKKRHLEHLRKLNKSYREAKEQEDHDNVNVNMNNGGNYSNNNGNNYEIHQRPPPPSLPGRPQVPIIDQDFQEPI